METSFLNIKNWMISVEVIRCLKQQHQANKKVSRFHFTLIALCLVTVELFLSEISIIQSSPLHCRQFFWSQRYQTTYSPYLSNCWFARDVTAAMLVGKSQGITKLHYLSREILLYRPPKWPPCHVVPTTNEDTALCTFRFHIEEWGQLT